MPLKIIISNKRTKIIIIILSITRSPKKIDNNLHLKNNNKVDRRENNNKIKNLAT